MKRIISILLCAIMLVGAVSVLASCGGGSEEPNTFKYSVTVVDGEGAPVANAQVSFINKDTGKKKLVATDKSGVAVYESETELNLEVSIFSANGYEIDPTKTYTLTDNAVTVTVAKKSQGAKETYTVYVKDASGNAVAGANVHICDNDGICLTPVLTDADGKAEFVVDEGKTWKAKFVSGTEYTYFEDGSFEVTLIQ